MKGDERNSEKSVNGKMEMAGTSFGCASIPYRESKVRKLEVETIRKIVRQYMKAHKI